MWVFPHSAGPLAFQASKAYDVIMADASGKRITKTQGKPGRRAMGARPAKAVAMRFSDEFLAEIDEWRRYEADLPVRSEAIRRLIEIGLKTRRQK